MHVLIAAQDIDLVRSLALLMQSRDIRFTHVDSGEDAIDAARGVSYDLILLDTRLPDMHGVSCIKGLRSRRVKTPVLILSLEADVSCMVAALNAGADDYLPRPHQNEELIARMQAVVRRSNGVAQNVIQCGPLTLYLNSHALEVKGQRVHLTGREYAILQLLCIRAGSTITKEMILDNVYGGMDEPELKIIDVFICKLRKKLMAATGQPCIETVWGRGYTIPRADEAPVEYREAA